MYLKDRKLCSTRHCRNNPNIWAGEVFPTLIVLMLMGYISFQLQYVQINITPAALLTLQEVPAFNSSTPSYVIFMYVKHITRFRLCIKWYSHYIKGFNQRIIIICKGLSCISSWHAHTRCISSDSCHCFLQKSQWYWKIWVGISCLCRHMKCEDIR